MNKKENKEVKSGWLSRLKGGLSRSSSVLSKNINDLMANRKLDEAAIEELEEILITSANFTGQGMRRSIEMGIYHKGRPAEEAEDLIQELIHDGYFNRI